jgi:hypothetical protein
MLRQAVDRSLLTAGYVISNTLRSMRRGWRFRGLLASAAVVACLAPASATAERFVTNPSLATGFQLRGSHGYEIEVSATGHKYVTLTASRGLSEASYTVPGRASSSRIIAHFGSLGRVSVRFDGSPVRRNNERKQGRYSCAGPRSIHQRGTFSGVIRFKGEHGFTAIDTRRAEGVLRKSFRRVCKQRQARRQPMSERGLAPPALRAKKKYQFVEGTLLALSWHGGRLTALLINEAELTFGPRQSDRFALSFIAAGTRESVGRMWISRFYVDLGVGEGNELRATPPGTDPVEATVKISKPFSGRATYREDPGSPPTWSGSLGVQLPGGGTVPLTGPGFGVGLCQGTSEKQLHACERKSFGTLRASTARALLQGSGSHSQAFWDAKLSWSR